MLSCGYTDAHARRACIGFCTRARACAQDCEVCTDAPLYQGPFHLSVAIEATDFEIRQMYK